MRFHYLIVERQEVVVEQESDQADVIQLDIHEMMPLSRGMFTLWAALVWWRSVSFNVTEVILMKVLTRHNLVE